MSAEWTAAHNGLLPNAEVLTHIDRRAWAIARPNKPPYVDEATWEATVRDEIAQIDPALLVDRSPLPVVATAMRDLDLDHLAAVAIVRADERSTSSGGRFNMFDLRAGATRAVAGAGVVASRIELDDLIDEVTSRARAGVLLMVGVEPPEHVKALMATETARQKIRLVAHLDALAAPGRALLVTELRRGAGEADLATLDESQIAAACAIAGSHGLVAVSGPAGAGKTTMLRVAFQASASRGQRMLVVAPTRKAASVASREVGSSATSIHALLFDHGYRWASDDTGAVVWSRLTPGDVDPTTQDVYGGATHYVLSPGDQIVVDEAGMVDLQTANILAELAIQLRVRVAMVGDPQQAMPVGHAGAMGAAIRHANASVELDIVHRFRDADYGALTLQIRSPRDRDHALQVADKLHQRGHLERVGDHDAARQRMVDGYFDWHRRGKRVAIVTSTNAEADVINTAIQQRRIDAGELDTSKVAWGRDERRILIGDTVQTRRNDPRTGVENRAQWTVSEVRENYIDLTAVDDCGQRTRIATSYAVEHLQLAYASTVHGAQGETADASIVGPDVDAAGLYVGLTRGRIHNLAIAVAPSHAAARSLVADSMLRGLVELTMQDAAQAAEAELRWAAKDRARASTAPFANRERAAASPSI